MTSNMHTYINSYYINSYFVNHDACHLSTYINNIKIHTQTHTLTHTLPVHYVFHLLKAKHAHFMLRIPPPHQQKSRDSWEMLSSLHLNDYLETKILYFMHSFITI